MDQYQYADCSKTSVKVHHQPGGASQWSIGWAGDDSGVINQNKNQRKPPIQQNQRQVNQENYFYAQSQGYPNYQSRPPMAPPNYSNEYQPSQRVQMNQQQQQQFGARADSGERTSVKVHAPPGGKTSINIFGGYEANEHNISPSRLRPKPRDVQYKIGAQYQVQQEIKSANNYGPSSFNQPASVGQWQQQQNQRSSTKIQKYEEVPQSSVQWPSRVDEPDRLNRGGYRQPSPQRMAGQNLVNPGYVPSQYNNNQNISGVRKSQQNYGYENMTSAPVRYQQQQSDLNFGGLKQTQPPGGRSQIVLN